MSLQVRENLLLVSTLKIQHTQLAVFLEEQRQGLGIFLRGLAEHSFELLGCVQAQLGKSGSHEKRTGLIFFYRRDVFDACFARGRIRGWLFGADGNGRIIVNVEVVSGDIVSIYMDMNNDCFHGIIKKTADIKSTGKRNP